MRDFDLTGRRALVTGGTSGIGLGIARGLLDAGADVMLWGRDERRLQDALAGLDGGRAHGLSCDVSDEAAVAGAFARTVERLGGVDVCFANAGVAGVPTRFAELSATEWRRVLATNLDGTFFTLREAARHMLERGQGGSLIATSSLGAHDGMPGNEAYAASKGAVEAIVRSLAVELARHDIRVNALVPGWVRTPMLEPALANERLERGVMARIPQRRWGDGEDYRGVAVFLASRASGYLTGQALIVDGGYAVF
jgi:NAD(P)-dependent dehydrogenase (short-subunit alcohol dehydrogenase family)